MNKIYELFDSEMSMIIAFHRLPQIYTHFLMLNCGDLLLPGDRFTELGGQTGDDFINIKISPDDISMKYVGLYIDGDDKFALFTQGCDSAYEYFISWYYTYYWDPNHFAFICHDMVLETKVLVRDQEYLCPCGYRFLEALGAYGCPNCCGDSGRADLVTSE